MTSLGIYSKDSKSTYNIVTCITIFIVAVFTITILLNEVSYPPSAEKRKLSFTSMSTHNGVLIATRGRMRFSLLRNGCK